VTQKANGLEAMAFCIPSADLLCAISNATSRTADKDVVLATHRARYVAKCLYSLGCFYGDALNRAVTGMDKAVAKNVDPTIAFNLVRQETYGTLRELKTIFTDDFTQEFERVFADGRVPESVRKQLHDTSNNCLAMWTAIEAPGGSDDSYRARVSLLPQKHRWYVERLGSELGMANPK
jgi:hypothetical protein